MTYKELNSNPEFQSLSFADQVQVRSAFLNKELSANPEFQSLSRNDQAYVYRNMLMATPAFENPQMGEIAQRWASDLNSTNWSKRVLAFQNIQKLSADSGLRNSFIGRIANGITQAAGTVLGAGNKGSPALEATTMKLNADTDKLLSYLSSYQFDDPRIQSRVDNSITRSNWAGNAIGLTGDLLMWHGTLGGTISRGLQGATESLLPSLGRFGTGVVKGVTESVSEGLFGTFVRDAGLARLNGETPMMARPAVEIAKDFGFWVGTDLLWSIGANTLLPFMRNALSTFRRKGVEMPKTTPTQRLEIEKYVMGGEEVPEVYHSLNQAQQTLIDHSRQIGAFTGGKPITPADRMRLFGLRYGISVDAKNLDDGLHVRALDLQTQKLYHFKGEPDATIGLAKLVGEDNLTPRASDADIAKLRSQLSGIQDSMPVPEELASRAAWDQTIEQPFLDALHLVKEPEPVVHPVRNAATEQPYPTEVSRTSQGIPPRVDSTAASETEGAPRTQVIETIAPGDSVTTKRPYVENIAEKHGFNVEFDRAPGVQSWKAMSSTGKVVTGDTLDRLVDNIYLSTLSTRDFGKLLRANGIKARMGKNAELIARTKDGIVVRGTDAVAMSRQLNFRPPELPTSFAPKYYSLAPTSAHLQITADAGVSGPRSLVMQSQAKFANVTDGRELIHESTNTGVRYLKMPDNKVRVSMPRSGIEMDFNTMKQARRWASRYPHSEKLFSEAVNRKGLEILDSSSDGYTITDGDHVYKAATRDQAEAVLRQFPDGIDGAPEFGHEFMDVPNEIAKANDWIKKTMGWTDAELKDFLGKRADDVLGEASVKAMADVVPEEYWAKLKPASSMNHVRRLFSNTQQFFEGYARQTKDTRMLELWRRFDDNVKFAETEMSRLQVLLDDAFKGSDGKLITPESRERIFAHMDAQTPKLKAATIRKYGDLSPAEVRTTNELRRLYDHLAQRFGIPFDRFVENYMPRIRKAIADNLESLNDMPLATDLLDKAWGGSAPEELRVWFDHARVQDIVTFAADKDAYTVAMKYLNQGVKKTYLAEHWRNIYKHMDDLSGKGLLSTSDALYTKVNAYREQVMGYFHPEWMKMAENFGERFSKWTWDNIKRVHKPGMTEEAYIKQGKLLYNKFFELNYFALMGYKPYLPIRNMTQIYTMLAPRVSNSSVDRAVGDLLKNEEGIYTYLKRIGVVTDRAPTINVDNPTSGFIGRRVEKSLRWFKNSDQFTRAIAYLSSTSNFDEAHSLLQQGKIRSKEKFFNISTMGYLSNDVRERIWKIYQEGIQTGKNDLVNTARMQFGAQTANDTMFLYRQRQSPELFKETLLGKMFGQYGTYAAGYQESVVGALRDATPAQRTAYIGRFLANHAGLWGLATALGIRATNYIPMAPSLFTGGPLFDLAIKTVQSLDTGYRGKEARAGILRDVMDLSPGAAQVKAITRAIRFADAGDSYHAWLVLMSAPVNAKQPLAMY